MRGRCAKARGINSRDPDHDVVRVQLALDVAIFEDGLCVGPDESALRESLIGQIERQKQVADQIVHALRDGAPPGRIFEMLRPLARHWPPVPSASAVAMNDRQAAGSSPEGHRQAPLLSMFARTALNQLINADDAALPDWFEAAAAISPVRLRQPQ